MILNFYSNLFLNPYIEFLSVIMKEDIMFNLKLTYDQFKIILLKMKLKDKILYIQLIH